MKKMEIAFEKVANMSPGEVVNKFRPITIALFREVLEAMREQDRRIEFLERQVNRNNDLIGGSQKMIDRLENQLNLLTKPKQIMKPATNESTGLNLKYPEPFSEVPSQMERKRFLYDQEKRHARYLEMYDSLPAEEKDWMAFAEFALALRDAVKRCKDE